MPAFPYTIGELHVRCDGRQAGNATGWRSLPYSVVEFSDDGGWLVEHEDGRRFRTRPGEAFFMPAGNRHRLTVPMDIVRMRTCWLRIDLETASGLDLLFGAESPLRLGSGASSACRRLMREIHGLDAAGRLSLAGVAQRNRAAWELVGILLANCRPGLAGGGGRSERMGPVLQFVRTHLRERVTRRDMARLAGLSPTRFHAVFKEAVGVAPLHYVLQCRLKLAQDLLANTGQAMAEIAEAAGFGTGHYFSRQFLRHIGQTPSAYRRQMRQQVSLPEGLRRPRAAEGPRPHAAGKRR
jgi:AraC-like DNA-binding protein